VEHVQMVSHILPVLVVGYAKASAHGDGKGTR
jgi:hypothetical protein